MEITEVRVRLAERKQDRLRAFCSVTFDDAFVIRDVKVIQGDQGLFVAMPSRKLTDRCPSCRVKNQLRSHYCSDCGARLPDHRAQLDDRGRPRLYVDIAHPVNAEARTHIENAVLAAYQEEMTRSHEPGYAPIPLDEGELEELEELEGPRLPADVEPPEIPRSEPPDRHVEAEGRRPAERREPTPERREPPAERREPTPERREPPAERREPPAERREPRPSPPAPPPPRPPLRKRRFGEGIFGEEPGTPPRR